ncbi:hypothetical protein DAPPUDRAFT_241307 [Daphnia pulex]|uniref:Uncharacterized protein n=1 Tax=Daphnia pulex TaxID=6669 RepID=E9GDX9_DAPPU|nr:hypothetical protein DAPPUDRAFT_241307 [Daphnia pulex]|eukprot:EFX82165.1 hypothetical protein DAPPUDRAFT_241307 [Daphnia pulex]
MLNALWYIKGVSYTRTEDDFNHSWTATKHAFTTYLQSSKYAYFISSKPVNIIGPTRMEQGYLPVFDPREEENCIANAVQVIKRHVVPKAELGSSRFTRKGTAIEIVDILVRQPTSGALPCQKFVQITFVTWSRACYQAGPNAKQKYDIIKVASE